MLTYFLISCSTPEQPPPVKEKVKRPVFNGERHVTVDAKYVIEPNQSIGPIKLHEPISKVWAFDPQALSKVLERGEENTHFEFILFPGSADEITFQMVSSYDDKVQDVGQVCVEKSSSWELANGVRIGTTIKELLAINSADIVFSGFEVFETPPGVVPGENVSFGEGELSKLPLNLKLNLQRDRLQMQQRKTSTGVDYVSVLSGTNISMRDLLALHPEFDLNSLEVVSFCVDSPLETW